MLGQDPPGLNGGLSNVSVMEMGRRWLVRKRVKAEVDWLEGGRQEDDWIRLRT